MPPSHAELRSGRLSFIRLARNPCWASVTGDFGSEARENRAPSHLRWVGMWVVLTTDILISALTSACWVLWCIWQDLASVAPLRSSDSAREMTWKDRKS